MNRMIWINSTEFLLSWNLPLREINMRVFPKIGGFFVPNHPLWTGFGTIINHPLWWVLPLFLEIPTWVSLWFSFVFGLPDTGRQSGHRSGRCPSRPSPPSAYQASGQQVSVSGWRNKTGWWLNHPSEKYARQNGFIFRNFRSENSKNVWVATT